MRVDLMNRVALVTGSARGIGRAIALALAENGARIAVSDVLDGEHTCEEIRERGGEARFFSADVSSADAVNELAGAIERNMGPIDILVNNAGIGARTRVPIQEFPEEEWRRIISVDLDGVFYCSRVVSRRMIERRKGAIINIASVFGVIPARMQCAYTAAKAGVVNFTRTHAVELGPYGIRVNAVAPGSTLTQGTRAAFFNPAAKEKGDSLLSHIPLGRPGEVEDIAKGVLYLASDDANYVTGHVLVIDGGWTAGYTRDLY